MPGSSSHVQQSDVATAIARLAGGHMRSLNGCSHGDCPDPISSGWARYLMVPALANASSRALAWHTGCEQQYASRIVFEEAAKAGLRVGCENSGGIFDSLSGQAYEQAVTRFFDWSVQHDAAVTFLISDPTFYSDMSGFLRCEQREFSINKLDAQCFQSFCMRCRTAKNS